MIFRFNTEQRIALCLGCNKFGMLALFWIPTRVMRGVYTCRVLRINLSASICLEMSPSYSNVSLRVRMLHQSTNHFCISQFACNSIVGMWPGQKWRCFVSSMRLMACRRSRSWAGATTRGMWSDACKPRCTSIGFCGSLCFLSLVCERRCIQCLFCCYFSKPCAVRSLRSLDRAVSIRFH